MPLRTLFSDDHVTVTLDAAAGLVRYTRNSVPYPSIDVLRTQNERLTAALSDLTPESLGILIDVRSAPPRNDPAFEAEVTRAVGAMVLRYRARAFLVKTAVGGLQLRRLTSARGGSTDSVFTDEAAALVHLTAR